jgi:hypothetical protein
MKANISDEQTKLYNINIGMLEQASNEILSDNTAKLAKYTNVECLSKCLF